MTKRGRPQIQINWTELDKLCAIHCTLLEIADYFGCTPRTIERIVWREKGVNFVSYFLQKAGHGKISLRRKQWQMAQEGNLVMLIWLGKNILGQSDKVEEFPVNEDEKALVIEYRQRLNATRSKAIVRRPSDSELSPQGGDKEEGSDP